MATLRKVKRSELVTIKRAIIKEQKGLCPICGKTLLNTTARNMVVDHDHETGVIRGVLHRGCNGVEGKVLRYLNTWGKCKTLSEMIRTLERLVKYWKKHKTPQTEYIYPTHKTEYEKKKAAVKKKRKANG